MLRRLPTPISSLSRFRLAAALIIVLTAASLAACRWPWTDSTPSSSLQYSGTIVARETDLAFQVPGRISRLDVDEGDDIKIGQPIASLDSRDYELNLSRAQAEADASQASLALLEAGARSQEVKAAEATVTQARAQLKFAQAETQRITRLVPQHLASQDQLDRARMQQDVAQATLIQTQQQLALLKAGARRQEIDRARADNQARQQAVAVAQQQLDYVDLASPVAGTVTSRMAETGEVVAAGQAVFRVASLDHPWVRIYINEQDLPHVRLGQSAQIHVDGLPDRVFNENYERAVLPPEQACLYLRTGRIYTENRRNTRVACRPRVPGQGPDHQS